MMLCQQQSEIFPFIGGVGDKYDKENRQISEVNYFKANRYTVRVSGGCIVISLPLAA